MGHKSHRRRASGAAMTACDGLKQINFECALCLRLHGMNTRRFAAITQLLCENTARRALALSATVWEILSASRRHRTGTQLAETLWRDRLCNNAALRRRQRRHTSTSWGRMHYRWIAFLPVTQDVFFLFSLNIDTTTVYVRSKYIDNGYK